MTYNMTDDFSRLLNIAYNAVYEVVSPSARSNVTDVIAAKAVIQYYEAIENGDDIHSPEGWVTATARCRGIDAMRKWTLEKQRGHRIDVDDRDTDAFMAMAASSLGSYLDAGEEPGADMGASSWVRELIESVVADPMNREIALRCIVDGEKPGDVAADLGMDAPVVSNRVARLKGKLRSAISADDLRS